MDIPKKIALKQRDEGNGIRKWAMFLINIYWEPVACLLGAEDTAVDKKSGETLLAQGILSRRGCIILGESVVERTEDAPSCNMGDRGVVSWLKASESDRLV